MDLRVDDRFAIEDLLAKYAVLMDRQDEGWVDLFDDDASLEVAGKDPVPKPGLKQFFLNLLPDQLLCLHDMDWL